MSGPGADSVAGDAAAPAFDGYARVFLLSHMRALTSLTGHILGSHPRISGYSELHLDYADAHALDAQRAALLANDGIKPQSRYLFDKLLHNDYRLLPDRLGATPLKILVALREPEASLRSIVHLFARKPDPDRYASPLAAAHYYVSRLNALAGFCRATTRPYFYFDADVLRRAPATLLPGLASWLELDTPLSERYAIFSQTGQARRGDSSPKLLSGRIDNGASDYAPIDLPAAVRDETRAAYRACRDAIVAGAAVAVCA